MSELTKEELDKIAEYKQLVKLYDYSPSEIIHKLNMCISDARYEAFKGCLICLTIYLGLELLITTLGIRVSKLGMVIGILSVVILYWLNPRSRIDWRYFKTVKSIVLITMVNFEVIIERKISLDSSVAIEFYESLMFQGAIATEQARLHEDQIHKEIKDLYNYMIYKIFLMSLEEEGEET